MLLSRQACEELGVINPSVPTVGCHSTDNHNTVYVGEIDAAEMIQSEFDLIPCSPDKEAPVKGPTTCLGRGSMTPSIIKG